MQLPLGRKAILLSSAIGLCIVVVSVIGIGLLRLQNDPRTTSLSLRVNAEDTEYFIRSSDRVYFQKTINTVLPTHSGQLPEGDRYEFALLQTNSGASWVIYVHQLEEGRHITLVSEENPELFLPSGKSKSSLGRTPLMRSYVASQDRDYIFMRPQTLPKNISILQSISHALLSDVTAILILPEENREKGLLVVDTAHNTNLSASIKRAPLRNPPAELTLEFGDGTHALQAVSSLLKEEDPSLHAGLAGIMKYMLKSTTDSTDTDAFMEDLVQGGTNIEFMRGKDTAIAVTIMGTAKSKDRVLLWLERAAKMEDGAVKRSISLSKGENMRIDITKGSGDTLVTLGENKGWTLLRAGASGSSALYAAINGKNYVLSTDASTLPPFAEAEVSNTTQNDRAVFRGSTDLPWLLHILEEKAPELSRGLRTDLEQLLGMHAARITWSMKPALHGWMIDWSISRSSPETGKLAK